MVDRRRSSRPLNHVPQTELELMWDISERLSDVETKLADHIQAHVEDKKARAGARALIWTNAFVVASIIASFVIHYLPAK